MSTADGRRQHEQRHAPPDRSRGFTTEQLEASGVERGRARYAAQKGNGSARDALAADDAARLAAAAEAS